MTFDPRPIQDAWQERCLAYACFEVDPDWEDAEVAAKYFKLIDAAEVEIANHPAVTPLAIELRLWIALSHAGTSCLTRMASGVSVAIEQGDIDTLRAVHAELDWQEKLILIAILNLRGENL